MEDIRGGETPAQLRLLATAEKMRGEDAFKGAKNSGSGWASDGIGALAIAIELLLDRPEIRVQQASRDIDDPVERTA